MSSLTNEPISFISTQKVNLQNNKHFIEPKSFIFNIILDIGVIIFSFIVWRYLWVKLNVL
jgi:hypothetical protein